MRNITSKERSRYNELLIKFLKNDEFLELLNLTNLYYSAENIRAKQSNNVFISNPYERLVYDLENRETIINRKE